ncbi:hypothetical protein JS528_07335 [Bifidobacterium sp. MA2]|uniref:Uncharacterized protein n=1 Tax=Bifidobacterium santillanense TaxID=2809028 RepID=A0ABS5UQL6_9BIFI|nr:hypothetical protein [Bifidobacterium santillanense]MBT1173165.1 hypothetical protein [Bifidobacterium santillanense]
MSRNESSVQSAYVAEAATDVAHVRWGCGVPALTPRWFTPRDVTDYLFLFALFTLPVDGTVLGVYQPFWTPISPWLFALYALCNPRPLRRAAHRYAPFMVLPVVLVYLSAPGWAAFGFHPNAVLMSLSGVIAVPLTIAALEIALVYKQLDWRWMIRTILAAYWFAFAVGVFQWLAIRLDLSDVEGYFGHLMYRSYLTPDSPWAGSGLRPQFLFAEPSYIGMHLFGVLLPLSWMMRDRDSVYRKQLEWLIVVFAAGSVVMGAGTRIVLDCLVALAVIIVIHNRWHDAAQRRRGIWQLLGTFAATVVCFIANSRLSAIINDGAEGDGSFFARIYQSLGPLCGLVERPWTLLTGFGAGNINAATQIGSNMATWLLGVTGTSADNMNAASGWYQSMNPDTIWTMSVYTSFITEYGAIGLVQFLIIALRFITSQHMWTKRTVCWLVLVVYLYIQFEGYCLVAIPLLIWALTHEHQ